MKKTKTIQQKFYERMDKQLSFIKAWLERIEDKLNTIGTLVSIDENEDVEEEEV